MRPIITALAPLALLAAVLAFGSWNARAAGSGCTAHLAGVETKKKTPVEVTVFNTTLAPMTLDLVLFDAEGFELVNRPGEVEVGAQATTSISIVEQLSRDLTGRQKPYEGLVGIQLTGDAPFSSANAIVHATQYIGNSKRPKSAFVVSALFQEE